MGYRLIVSGIIVLILAFRGTAQELNLSGKVTCMLTSKEEIILFPNREEVPGYYYLPCNLRLSSTSEQQPEFLFMTWKSSSATQTDNVVMHWLLTWGLTAEQEKEVQVCLHTQVDSTALLLGAVNVETPEKMLWSGKNTTYAQLLQNTLSAGANVPTLPGGKSASSFRLKSTDAYTLEQSLQQLDKWDEVYVEMPFYWMNHSQTHTLRLAVKTILTTGAKCAACMVRN